MLAEGAGICVTLGAAGDLTGVRLLRAQGDIKKKKKTWLQSVKHTHRSWPRYQGRRTVRLEGEEWKEKVEFLPLALRRRN